MKNHERINAMIATIGRITQILGALFKGLPIIRPELVAPLQLPWDKKWDSPDCTSPSYPAYIGRVGLHAIRTHKLGRDLGNGSLGWNIPIFLKVNEAYKEALKAPDAEVTKEVDEASTAAEKMALGKGYELLLKQWDYEGEGFLIPIRRFNTRERDFFVVYNLMKVFLGLGRNKYLRVENKFLCLAAASRLIKLMKLLAEVEDIMITEEEDPCTYWKQMQMKKFAPEDSDGFEKTITKWVLESCNLSGQMLEEEAQEINALNPHHFIKADCRLDEDLRFVDAVTEVAKKVVNEKIPHYSQLMGMLHGHKEAKAQLTQNTGRRRRRDNAA